ncbi:MAG: 30S ribosomal protein S6 [Alphaproteobacteria bacterium]|nr:30S ribosomal protein S6 [Alphaproteobacteria bacterium]MBV8548137.1 30S ribosomal protein S6 [Alphaproteobacteria bacterium]
MPFYESIFIARQDIAASQVEALTTSCNDIIQAKGGKVTKTEQWGLRTLAYRINKNRKGHYVLMNLDCPPAAVAEMERTLRINEDVLRFSTIRVEELETGPSAIMRKEERAERSSTGGSFDRPRRGPRDNKETKESFEGDAA